MHETESDDRPLPAAAAAALSTGHLVDAIKYVREAEGLGLMEAKQRIDAYVARDPMLMTQLAEQQARMKRGLIKWVLIVDLVLIAVVAWYFFGR